MLHYITMFLSLKSDKRAVTALEYGLIAATIAAVLITVFTTIGTDLSTSLNAIEAKLAAL